MAEVTEGRHRRPPPPPRRPWSQAQIAVACSIAALTVLGGVAAIGTSVAPEAEASPASTPPAVERSTWTPRSLPPLRVASTAVTTTASTTFNYHADTLSHPTPIQRVSEYPTTAPYESPAVTAERSSATPAVTTTATTTQPTQTAPSGSTTTTASSSATASTTTTSPTASSSEETTTLPSLTPDITDTTEETGDGE